MPSTRAPSLQTHQLAPVATVAEIAAFERVDPRTLRAELEHGKVPGAFRRGRSWRIVTATYLAAITQRADGDQAQDASTSEQK